MCQRDVIDGLGEAQVWVRAIHGTTHNKNQHHAVPAPNKAQRPDPRRQRPARPRIRDRDGRDAHALRNGIGRSGGGRGRIVHFCRAVRVCRHCGFGPVAGRREAEDERVEELADALAGRGGQAGEGAEGHSGGEKGEEKVSGGRGGGWRSGWREGGYR